MVRPLFPALRAYFDEELVARTPGVSLFWEHGGYLIALIDHARRKIVDRQNSGVFHIGDMTGSFVKGTHFPDASDVGRRRAPRSLTSITTGADGRRPLVGSPTAESRKFSSTPQKKRLWSNWRKKARSSPLSRCKAAAR
jgi:hypothetical protein